MPVNTITGRAPGEMLLCKVNVRRNLFEYRFFVDFLKRDIAFETAGEYLEIFQTEGAEDLPDLFLVIAAFNEQTLRFMLLGGQTSVPRQNDTILGAGNANDLLVFICVRIRDVEAQYPKPPRELTHHHIGNKPGVLHGIIQGQTSESPISLDNPRTKLGDSTSVPELSQMKRQAEVVIIGGGVVGLSIAHHLAKRGMTDVVVLEKESMVGAGSTGRCAGGFRHQFSTEINIRLSLLSVSKLEHFAEELDQAIDFYQDGYLFLLQTPEDVASFRENVRLQRRLGIPVDFLQPDEIGRVLPDMEITIGDVRAATYCAIDGVSDPAGVTEGYRRAAVRSGVMISTDQEVVGIDIEHGRVTGVRTKTDRVSTGTVVNAAGPYAAVIGKMAGVDIPVVPLRRFIWTTKPFAKAPQRWTLVVDFSSGFYFHRESGGVLFGMGNREESPTFHLGVDWDFFDRVMEVAVHRFPPIADAAIKNAWAGSYETSPDAHPILGRVGGLDGFILANGFSGHGFQHAPAVGELIAEEILDGKAHTLDISPLRIQRFTKGSTTVEMNVV